tara:strand:+ start:3340 stop:4920 length:1581 start_codon:yes stop_codon:yes gene_type:complete
MSQTNFKELVRSEYVKCAKDPVYFLKKYCMIQHPIKGKIPFQLWDFQEKTLEDIKDNRLSVILKARQLGISTLTAGYSLWMMTFHQDKNILVIATKQDTAKNLVTKVRVMHANLPSWLKQNCVEDNKLSLRYKNGSQIKAVASSEEAGRSEALSLLVLDEAAFIEKIDTIWAAASQTLSTGGQCIALSTPNGVGNWFHRTWMDAEDGINGWNFIKLHWTIHPERGEEWRSKQDLLLGPSLAAQECDCSFITSGQTVIDGLIIEEYRENQVKDPIERRGFDSNLWVWEYPDYSRDYVLSADVSRGDGSDYSAFHVIDVESMKQVAEYKGKLGTKDFGNMCVSVATEYNKALLIVENNNIGWSAIQTIIDSEYPNLFYTSKDLMYVDTAKQMTNRYRSQDRNMVPGFSMTAKTRPLVISKLEEYFREKSVSINSQRLIDELFVFIYKNSKAEAMVGYNDDLVMSLAIGLWVRDTALRLRAEGIELTKRSFDYFQSHQAVYDGDDSENDSWKMDLPNSEKEDLTWLIGK